MTGATPSIAPGKQVTDFGLVLDSLPQAVLVTTKDNSIHYANMSAEGVFSASAKYLVRHNLDKFVPFGSPVLNLVDQVLATGAPVVEYQINVSTPRTGPDKIVDVYASPMADNSQFVVLVFRERSVADKIDRQLSHQGAARSVTGLAAMLAHEIKNPLSGIRGAAQLLEGVVTKADQELTQLITTETDRIVNIVNRMEVFSDERLVRPEAVNMHSVLEHVKRLAQNGFAKNVKISERYDPSLPLVSGDRDQLIQVFLNLVKNAAEAVNGRDQREIILSSAYRSGISIVSPVSRARATLPLEFSVTDNGPGIPDEIRSHVFEPFVTTRTNGSGLGLALVAKIIGSHGGIIECDSQPGATTFRVLLPTWITDGQNDGDEYE